MAKGNNSTIPSLLSAIKKAVDEDTRPGQYLLTGSANIQALPTVRESLSGRIAKIYRKNVIRELVNVLAAWSGKFMDISAIGSGLSIQRPRQK